MGERGEGQVLPAGRLRQGPSAQSAVDTPRAAAPAAGVEPFKRQLDILKLRRSKGLPEPQFVGQVVVEAVMSDGPMALQVQKVASLQDQNFLSTKEFEERLSVMIWHAW